AQLIDDLLAFSRLGRSAVEKKLVRPAELVASVLQDLRSEREGRQVQIKIGELPPCQADPALLWQVFANLIGNALKFSRGREQAIIEIGSRPVDSTEGDVVYFVKDNGAGFDMRYADKLFGVFQRLHRAEEFPGTGVGLAIVQRIVTRHGGRVWGEGRPGEGACFYFSLPRKTA
ncbi:MAG: sensor histidine kinase, partial [Burkholderiales bacterium]